MLGWLGNSTGVLVRQLGCKPHSEPAFLVCKIVMVILIGRLVLRIEQSSA